MKSYFNWSGGKDSALALYYAKKDPSLQIDCLLTSVNEVYDRISIHGVRRSLLVKQVASLMLPLRTIELPEYAGMDDYESKMNEAINCLKKDGYTNAIFGDIFLEDLRNYREQQLLRYNISAIFPLWKKNTTELLNEFLQLGFKTIIVCVNEKFLDRSFCGRIIDNSFLADLPENVDPCGENGEFHTFCFDGPVFKNPVNYKKGAITYRQYPAPKNGKDNCFKTDKENSYGFYFCDLEPDN